MFNNLFYLTDTPYNKWQTNSTRKIFTHISSVLNPFFIRLVEEIKNNMDKVETQDVETKLKLYAYGH